MHPEVERRSIWQNTPAANDCVGVTKVRVNNDVFKLTSQWILPTVSIKYLLPLEMLLVSDLDTESRHTPQLKAHCQA
jgi:hypothetical protein